MVREMVRAIVRATVRLRILSKSRHLDIISTESRQNLDRISTQRTTSRLHKTFRENVRSRFYPRIESRNFVEMCRDSSKCPNLENPVRENVHSRFGPVTFRSSLPYQLTANNPFTFHSKHFLSIWIWNEPSLFFYLHLLFVGLLCK